MLFPLLETRETKLPAHTRDWCRRCGCEIWNSSFSINDKVIVSSYDLGMNTDGGFKNILRVPSAWAVKLQKPWHERGMIYGTAGLTAGVSVLRLTELVKPKMEKSLFLELQEGVGSLSVSILAKLGYFVSCLLVRIWTRLLD
jgi:NADPH:quinone reductase-like Zn-dependent oxidoreductase